MAALDVTLLGPPSVTVDGAPLDVDTRKAIAVLAYVLVEGPTSRASLAALLWPDSDAAHARAALRRTLSVLQRALGGRWLDASRSTVAVDVTDLACDVVAWRHAVTHVGGHDHETLARCADCRRRLAAAADRYGGDFLAGFSLRDSPEFEDWVLLTAEDFRRLQSGLLDQLAEASLEAGDMATAERAASRRLRLEPLHEPTHRRLMLLRARTGDRAGAARQYRECAGVLERELGVAPLEETTALYEAIVAGRVPAAPDAGALSAAGAAGIDSVDPARPEAPQSPGTVPFVGRATELARATDVWRASGAGGRALVVSGEPGVGKTRLLDELAAAVDVAGGRVLWAQCFAGESHLAYGPIIALLEQAARYVTASAADDRLRAALHQAARLVPRLAAGSEADAPSPPLGGTAARAVFLDGVVTTLTAAAGGTRGDRSPSAPGLLVVEDVQWADEATADVLSFLWRRIPGRPMLLAMSHRGSAADLPGALRGTAGTSAASTVLRLGRLSRGDVAAVVAAALRPDAGQDELVDRLYAESEGLPLFLVAYLDLLATAGDDAAAATVPESVQGLLETLLDALDDLDRQVLATAAVIGRTFDLDTLTRASGRDEDETVTALDRLQRSGLVTEADPAGYDTSTPRYDFAHDKMRTVVLERTGAARRRLLHGRVADALARSVRLPAVQARLARHLELAGRGDEAAMWSFAAGDEARRVFAHADALRHYRRALELGHPDAAVLLERIADLETLAGRYDRALVAYREAAGSGGDGGRIDAKVGGVHLRRGALDDAERHLQQALRATPDPGPRARLLADLSLVAIRHGDLPAAHRWAEQALATAGGTTDLPAQAQAYNLMGVVARRTGETRAAAAHLHRAQELAQRSGDAGARMAALNNLGLVTLEAGDVDGALGHLRQALDLSALVGDRHREAALLNNLADTLHAAGRTEEAMSPLRRAVALFAEVGEPTGTAEPDIWKLVDW